MAAKERYRGYRKQSPSADPFKLAMEEYFIELNKEFPGHGREPFFLTRCTEKVRQSGRAASWNTHMYEGDSTPVYGIASYPNAVQFFFSSRDSATTGEILGRCRREFEQLSPEHRTSSVVLHFKRELEAAENSLDRLSKCSNMEEQEILAKHAKRQAATLNSMRKHLQQLSLGDPADGAVNPKKRPRDDKGRNHSG